MVAVENLELHYHELRDLYYDCAPDDEDFLSDNPEVQEQMDALDNLVPETSNEYAEAIRDHISFIYEWFPDGVDEEEQARILDILKEAGSAVQ